MLVAEDNPVNQRVIQRLLQRAGCSAALAANGEECLERASTGTFDLISMDCQMPTLDSYETTHRLREQGGELASSPIVALTASAMSGDEERCRAAGMDRYLTKSIRSADLEAVLARCLDAARRS